jgi:hypothetical protein
MIMMKMWKPASAQHSEWDTLSGENGMLKNGHYENVAT